MAYVFAQLAGRRSFRMGALILVIILASALIAQTTSNASSPLSASAVASNAPGDAPTSAPPLPASVHVNAGGGAVIDSTGQVWTDDAGFLGGSVASTTHAIAGTADPALYQSERYGMSGYGFPLANGSYTVTLGFSENAPWVTKRTFSVSAEGKPALTNLDLRAAAKGDYVALNKSFAVTVADEHLDLAFTAGANSAKVSTIAVVPVVSAAATTQAPSASGSTGSSARMPTVYTQSSTGPAPTSPQFGTDIAWEDFNGNAINPVQWYVYDNPTGDPSRTRSQTQVRDGSLQLVGLYNKAKGVHTSGGASWNLGRAKYGKWEIRMKADAGAGFSPTVLLWPDTENWPTDGELDVFEGGPWPKRDRGLNNVHNQANNNQAPGHYEGDFTQWHTFGVEWTPEKVTFLLDGKVTRVETDKRLVPTSSSMHIALENGTGCSWIICPNASTRATTTMYVDWVRQYR